MVGADTYSDLDLGNMSSRAWYSEIALYKFPDDPSQVWDFCVDWTQVGHFSQVSVNMINQTIQCNYIAVSYFVLIYYVTSHMHMSF